MSEKEKPRRSPFIFFAIILVVLALSIVALSQAIIAYLGGNFGSGNSLLLMGLIGLVASAYMMFQTRRGILKVTFEAPKVSTTITCSKCGFKNIRDFQHGDYILKEAEPCPKCNEKMMIASIYREVEEKKDEI